MRLETTKKLSQKEKNVSSSKERKTNKEHLNPTLMAKKIILMDYLKWTLEIPYKDFKIMTENLNNLKINNEKEKQLKDTLLTLINLITSDKSLEPKYYFQKIKVILESPALTEKEKNIFVKWLKENFIWFLVEKVKNNTENFYNLEALKETNLPIPKKEEYYYISAPWKWKELVELLIKTFPQYDWTNRVLVAELERE